MLAAASLCAAAASPVAIPAGEYELTTQTVLPHLEEALRYATTRERRCLRSPDATGVFPLLAHPAFTGCELEAAGGDGLHFTLKCSNPEAASGSAVFEADGWRVTALLQVKMGGKNMTLSQRISGPRVGSC